MNFIKHKINIKIFLLFIIIHSLMGCNMVLMNPKGIIGLEQKKLILITLGLMLIIVIPVIFMVLWFAKKFNVSNKQSTYWPSWAYSFKIEFICWLIPIIIITILAIITWKTTHTLDPYKPLKHKIKPIIIQVIATDWKWIFLYPEKNIATINEIVIPINVPINFKITSESVMNSFFIPALGSQIYAMPGMQTKLHLIANESGIYKGFSSSYSGYGFSNMKFNVIVTPNINKFNNWIKKVKLSTKKLNTMSDFYKLAKPSNNVPVTYFSDVKPNLYETLILHYGHKHNIDHIKKN